MFLFGHPNIIKIFYLRTSILGVGGLPNQLRRCSGARSGSSSRQTQEKSVFWGIIILAATETSRPSKDGFDYERRRLSGEIVATVSAVPTWWCTALLHHGRIRRSDAAEDLFDVVNEALAVSRGRIDPAKRSGSTSLRGDRKDYYRNDRPSKTTTVNVYDRPSKTTAVSTVAKGYCKRLGQRLLLLLIKPFS